MSTSGPISVEEFVGVAEIVWLLVTIKSPYSSAGLALSVYEYGRRVRSTIMRVDWEGEPPGEPRARISSLPGVIRSRGHRITVTTAHLGEPLP